MEHCSISIDNALEILQSCTKQYTGSHEAMQNDCQFNLTLMGSLKQKCFHIDEMFFLAALEVTSAASDEEKCQKWYFHCSVGTKKEKKNLVPHFTTWHLNLIFALTSHFDLFSWPYSCTSSSCRHLSSCATTCKIEYCWNLCTCIKGSDRCYCTLVNNASLKNVNSEIQTDIDICSKKRIKNET